MRGLRYTILAKLLKNKRKIVVKMPKTPNDVLQEWVLRGYITAEQATDPKYISYINQAKDSILGYCNIPLKAQMPDDYFYAWIEISYATSTGGIFNKSTGVLTGAIKSVSEGDTKIEYADTSVNQVAPIIDYSSTLKRRIAW